MFSKGAKRKLDEDEEGLEGKTLEVMGGGSPLVPECLSKVSYTLQRQTIFNISLMKLYSQRPLGEPSLERRVLINNMLRRIQDELKQEGSLRPLLLPPSPPPDDPMDEGFRDAPSFGVLSAAVTAQVSQPSALLMSMMAPPPPSPHPMMPPHSPAPQAFPSRAPLDSCLTPASLLEEDAADSAFCVPSPPTPPLSPPPSQSLPSPPLSPAPSAGTVPVLFPPSLSDMEVGPSPAITRTAAANTTTMSTSPAPPHNPLTPFLSTALRDCRSTAAKAEESLSCEAPPTPPPAGPGDTSVPPSCPPPPSPSGFLSDLALDDVLFADIDTSMYDFDPLPRFQPISLSKST
ncbi:SERTA domain-containing protein 2b isoform X2 [Gouania willdenowi]|uniref:SERTA domain-containing protein 2b isoform X2 n=1 Tax=Gouania willdenowi TaxID=441366 RepID=UPI0010565971|nr:SERTA domain-containing protein 2 isoform X2 [Gouania willdenowi]